MARVEEDIAVSVHDLKKDPLAVMTAADGRPVAILDQDCVVAWLVPAETFETMVDRLDDVGLARIIAERAGETSVPIAIDDL